MNKKIIMPVLCLFAILLISGCTSSFQIGGGTGGGTTYGRIITVEHYKEWLCDNWLVYFENDVGTGGEYSRQTAGSYCIKDNSAELISQLQSLAAKGVRVEAKYETAYSSICGCDYDAWIYSVKELNKSG